MKKYTFDILVMFWSIGIASCQCNNEKVTKRIIKSMDEVTTFSYDIGMSAPGPYSMAVTDAYFTYTGDYTGQFNFNTSFYQNGFTNTGGLGNFSRGPKPMPDSLYIEWLSIIERKIYRANIDLHKNGIRDSMLKLFRQGYWDDDPSIGEYEDREAIKRAGGKRVTYDAISITILPGGKLWMYIMDQYGIRRVFVGEIGQGYEVPFDSAIHRRIDRNLGHTVKGEKHFFDIMQPDINGSDSLYAKFLAQHGKTYAYGLFPRYQERFRYDIAFEFEKPNTRLKEQTHIWFINEECYWSEQRTPLDTKTRVTTILTGWIVDDSILYTARFYFNEQELLGNFDKMYKKDRDAQGTLLIKVNKYSNSFFKIYLKVGNDSVEFEKTHVHVFKESWDPIQKRGLDNDTLHFWNFRDEPLPSYIGRSIYPFRLF